MHVFAFLSILYGKKRVEAVCGTAWAYGKSHRDWTVWSLDRTKSPSRQLVLKLGGRAKWQVSPSEKWALVGGEATQDRGWIKAERGLGQLMRHTDEEKGMKGCVTWRCSVTPMGEWSFNSTHVASLGAGFETRNYRAVNYKALPFFQNLKCFRCHL